jgi:hypothetical protein
MVSRVDLVLTPAARRIALHHRLRRRPRWTAELDRLLTPVDPWDHAMPLDWALTATAIGERAAAGRDLAAAGWCP